MVFPVRHNRSTYETQCVHQAWCAKKSTAASTSSSTLPSSRGFSLIELLVVLAIAAMLMALLMPQFARLRESARQAGCASNEHQIGLALAMFADENDDRMPYSEFSGGDDSDARKMMVARIESSGDWDSMGHLFGDPDQRFIRNPKAFYCPSHIGSHPSERYDGDWANPGHSRISINYHYRQKIAGGKKPVIVPTQKYDVLQRMFPDEPILTDGMRSKQDFNHVVGTNMLRLDSSVKWFEDPGREIYNLLPDEMDQHTSWRSPWSQFNKRNR